MDALAAEAFLNAEHRVCGLRMLPLSLGHAFTLEAVGSPFYNGTVGTEAELRMAAWICSRPALALPNMKSMKCRFWQLWNVDFNTEVQKWRVYVNDYCAPPQFWTKPTSSRADCSKIPNPVVTAVRLMRLGMSEKQAWSTPVGAASWYESASFEAESGANLDIVSDSERIAIVRQKKRQLAKKQNV